MKKMIFKNMKDLKKMIELFEVHNVEYSWYFLNKKYEMHLGGANVDHVKMLIRDSGSTVEFKWGEYYW